MSEIFNVDALPNRTIEHNGREYLFFSGTAYLGLPQNSAFQEMMVESMSQYGTVFGSSRNGNLRLAVYEEAEAKLAASVADASAEAPLALTLSSGMMAGQVIVNWLRGQSVSFLYAPNAHPALWHESVVALPTLSFADWAAQLPEQLRTMPPGPVAILTNSLDAVCSAYYNFDWIADLPADRPITLVVDDSHGLGVLTNGRGIWPQISEKINRINSSGSAGSGSAGSRSAGSVRFLVTASLAKAMGMPGGVIFGDAGTISALRQTAFFGACSPMPPAYLAAYLRAETLINEGREQLRKNILFAEKLLLPTGLFHHANGYPVFFTERDDLYQFLLENGIFIYSFAYPTSADRANTRVVISAFHEPKDIEQLAERVSNYLKIFG